MQRAVISGTGSYIPHETKTNYDFIVHDFYGDDHTLIKVPPAEIVEKFKLIFPTIFGFEQHLNTRRAVFNVHESQFTHSAQSPNTTHQS